MRRLPMENLDELQERILDMLIEFDKDTTLRLVRLTFCKSELESILKGLELINNVDRS